MKKLFYCAASAMLLASAAHAYTGFGMCNFGKENMSHVVCYGPAVLKGTNVSGDMKVAGPLSADSISAGTITIAGTVKMLNSKVIGEANIVGTLDANNVEFMKNVNITSNSITLSHSKLDGTIKVTEHQSRPQLLIECGTIITGSVIFTDKAGIVQMTDDSSVQGKIVNGSQEFVRKSCN